MDFIRQNGQSRGKLLQLFEGTGPDLVQGSRSHQFDRAVDDCHESVCPLSPHAVFAVDRVRRFRFENRSAMRSRFSFPLFSNPVNRERVLHQMKGPHLLVSGSPDSRIERRLRLFSTHFP